MEMMTPSGWHTHGAAPNPNAVLSPANQPRAVTPGPFNPGAPGWRGDDCLEWHVSDDQPQLLEQLTKDLARLALSYLYYSMAVQQEVTIFTRLDFYWLYNK